MASIVFVFSILVAINSVTSQDTFLLNGFRQMVCGFDEGDFCTDPTVDIEVVERNQQGCVDMCISAATDPLTLRQQLLEMVPDLSTDPEPLDETNCVQLGMPEYLTPNVDPLRDPTAEGNCDRTENVAIVSYNPISQTGTFTHISTYFDELCSDLNIDVYNTETGAARSPNEGIYIGLFKKISECNFEVHSYFELSKQNIVDMASNGANGGSISWELTSAQRNALFVDTANTYHYGLVFKKAGFISWPTYDPDHDQGLKHWCIADADGSPLAPGDILDLGFRQKRSVRNIMIRLDFCPTL